MFSQALPKSHPVSAYQSNKEWRGAGTGGDWVAGKAREQRTNQGLFALPAFPAVDAPQALFLSGKTFPLTPHTRECLSWGPRVLGHLEPPTPDKY